MEFGIQSHCTDVCQHLEKQQLLSLCPSAGIHDSFPQWKEEPFPPSVFSLGCPGFAPHPSPSRRVGLSPFHVDCTQEQLFPGKSERGEPFCPWGREAALAAFALALVSSGDKEQFRILGHSEQLLAKPWRWEGSAQEGQPHLEGMVRGLSWEGSSSFRSEVRTWRGAVWAWITQELQGVVSRGVPEALEKCFISSCLKDDSKSHFYQNGQFLISFFCCVAASLL